MLYLERRPHPALAPFIKTLWYTRDPNAVAHHHQRILPTGNAQIILSLARDYLTDANHPTTPLAHSPAFILLGLYSRHQQIDTIDLAELIGIVFQPGGTLAFFPHTTHTFTNCETSLEDLWGRSAITLRDQLREAPTPNHKFAILEHDLLQRLRIAKAGQPHPAIPLALTRLHSNPSATRIASLTRHIGLSPRRLSQLFHEQVGVSPKLYYRIQRFQQAVQQLHRGADIRWSELAISCGYYDQSHFANDFHAFSGLSPTTYSTTNRLWANHLSLDGNLL